MTTRRTPAGERHQPSREDRAKRDGKPGELRVLVHLVGPYRGLALSGIGAAVVVSLLGLVPAYLTKVLIDEGIKANDRSIIVAAAVASAVLAGLMWAFTIVQNYALFNTAYRSVVSIQHLAFEHLLELPPSYHDSVPVGTNVSRLTNDASAARNLITTGLPALINTVVTATGALVLMLILDWDMALVTLAVVPLLVGATAVYRRWVTPLYRSMRETIGGVTGAANETLGVVGLIQGFNQEERHREEFADAVFKSRAAEYRTIRAGAVYFPTTSILTAVATGSLIIYGGIQVVRGNSEVGTMVAFFGYLGMFLGPLASMSSVIRSYQSGMAALGNVLEIVDEPIPTAGVSPAPGSAGDGSIRLLGVSAEVAGRAVLEHLDVAITPGTVVAFVGDAESGRSAIARVVAGLDPPSQGIVTLDGVDVSTIERTLFRSRVGYVSARIGLFDGSIRQNLLVACPDADDVMLRADLAGMFGSGFVDQLSDGLDTEVGRDGRNLPVGTRQAVIIARAIMRQPQVLVLDAAVDSLDATALGHLARSRDVVLPGGTIVAATSQPLIAGYADQVILLEDGRIAESGQPRDLLSSNTRFAALMERWHAGLEHRGTGH